MVKHHHHHHHDHDEQEQQQQQQQQEEEIIIKQEQKQSLRSKAAHLVSDLTTVLFNPISDRPAKNSSHNDSKSSEHSESDSEDSSEDDGPDTSSFTAFLYSLLASSESHNNTVEDESNPSVSSEPLTKENAKRKSLLSRGKQSLGKAFYQAARFGGFRNQGPNGSSDMVVGNGSNSKTSFDEGISMQTLNQSLPSLNLPETSEPSLLLSEKTRSVLYKSLPVIVQDRKWVLLYSTWRHGISLSTLYRRSMLWPGLSLLAVGDRKGAVFGGLVEAPLRPTNKRRYQGTNSTFVFTNVSGHPIVFRPTGINRYFTLCSTNYLALGGGGHFALYLDGDLLLGSSSSSETYGNPCLAQSEDFEVKEIELWGFIYASKYEEMMASLQTEAPGICHL